MRGVLPSLAVIHRWPTSKFLAAPSFLLTPPCLPSRQIKDVFLPWYNAYRFFVQNVLRLQAESGQPFVPSHSRDSDNVLDHWINSATDTLVLFVREEMAAYRLYTVVPFLLKFIDNLTNIYVRFNRKRLKGSRGDHDCRTALSTLYQVSRRPGCGQRSMAANRDACSF